MTQELLTLEEAMRKLTESGRVLVPRAQSWWVQDEATYEEANPRPAISEASWPEACSVEWGVPVAARDDAAELRAALAKMSDLVFTMLSAEDELSRAKGPGGSYPEDVAGYHAARRNAWEELCSLAQEHDDPDALDRANQCLLIQPEPPKAEDFDTCQAYLKTCGLALVDVYYESDLGTPAFWIVATTSGHELSRGLTWVRAYADFTRRWCLPGHAGEGDDLTTAYMAGFEDGKDRARDEAAELRALLNHPLLNKLMGELEDNSTGRWWGMAEEWMDLRDAALTATEGES